MVPPTLVNVCGAGRSGTTMLDLMLGNSKRAFSCGEVFAWFRPWEPEHHQIQCSCDEDPCPVWEEIKVGPEYRFHRDVVDIVGVKRVIDSSKDLAWIRDSNRWAPDNGMRAINVLIWKEPLELAYSWWKRGWLPSDPMRPNESIGRKYVRKALRSFVDYHATLLDFGFPVVSVSYRELVADPARVLESTCRAVGLPYEPGQERFWTKKHHFVFGSGTVRRALRRRNFSIRASELPDEFVEVSRELAARAETDEEVQAVVNRIRACAPTVSGGA